MAGEVALDQEIKRLGEYFNRVLQEQAGAQATEAVEDLVALARLRRQGETGAADELARRVAGFDLDRLDTVMRALSISTVLAATHVVTAVLIAFFAAHLMERSFVGGGRAPALEFLSQTVDYLLKAWRDEPDHPDARQGRPKGWLAVAALAAAMPAQPMAANPWAPAPGAKAPPVPGHAMPQAVRDEDRDE